MRQIDHNCHTVVPANEARVMMGTRNLKQPVYTAWLPIWMTSAALLMLKLMHSQLRIHSTTVMATPHRMSKRIDSQFILRGLAIRNQSDTAIVPKNIS